MPATPKPKVAAAGEVTVAFRLLLVYDLDLLVEHLSCKPVDRNVHTVMLFAFRDEFSEVRFSLACCLL